jgi:flagellar export protein FliJ
MKRFQFPLDRVRRWRQEQASLEESKLQQLFGQLEGLAAEKAMAARDRAASDRSVLEQASIDASELQALDAYRSHVRTTIGKIEERQLEVTAQIEAQRQRLMEARRQAELLEHLKTKMFGEWQTLVGREEETVAGELYLAKWQRR